MPEVPTLPPIADAPLSVVLLLTHEQARVEELVAEWVTFLNGLDREYEILLVDDATPEPTASAAARLPERFTRLRLIRHPAPQGEGATLRSALVEARHPLLFYARCDPRYQPADLKKLLRSIDQVHLVGGYRAGRPVPWAWQVFGYFHRGLYRLLFSYSPPPLPGWLGWKRHLGSALARLAFGVRYRDAGCPFLLARREIFARIPLQSDSRFVHVEILAKANFLGCLLGEEVPLAYAHRQVAPEESTSPLGEILIAAKRLFQHPDFGPLVLAAAHNLTLVESAPAPDSEAIPSAPPPTAS